MDHRRPPDFPRESPDFLRWNKASGCIDFSVASAPSNGVRHSAELRVSIQGGAHA
jgi:hypothetical protein